MNPVKVAAVQAVVDQIWDEVEVVELPVLPPKPMLPPLPTLCPQATVTELMWAYRVT